MMGDDEILALAFTVSEKMRLLAAARAAFGGDSEIYTAQYTEYETRRASVTLAERELAAAKEALDEGLATR